MPSWVAAKLAQDMDENVRFQPLLSYQPTVVDEALRGTLGYAQMYWAGTNAMLRTLSLPLRGSLKRRMLQRTKRLFGWAAASQPAMRLLARWHYGVVDGSDATRQYRRAFEQFRPSVLFCSHQRSPEALPAVLAARQLGIPTATFIFSWDNLSSKGRICAPYDHFLVWSELMASELKQYYPDVTDENIHIVGTPQFEPYADESLLWSREELFRRIGGDPNRKLLCFSGGDAGTCPEDPEHVRVLAELIRQGRIRGNPQVLVRPVPSDDGSRYGKVRRDYPEILFQQPPWFHATVGDWSQVFPSQEDIQLLANLTQHADMNLNLGSTMTLDFALRDTPVVNVAFDCASPPLFGMPVFDFYYCYEHFQPVLALGATRIARSPEQLAEHVNAYLDDPSLDREGRRKLVELEIGAPLGDATRLLLSALRRISAGGKN